MGFDHLTKAFFVCLALPPPPLFPDWATCSGYDDEFSPPGEGFFPRDRAVLGDRGGEGTGLQLEHSAESRCVF